MKELKNIVLVALTTSCILLVKFNKVIFSLNDYFFGFGIDAYKSYYNFSYLLRHGEGLKHQGINYPYGDHLHYINSHPLYLYFFRTLEPIVDLTSYGVGIINGLMLLSIVIAAPIIYLILREYKMPVWYSIICALIIQFLFPQMARISGHFEMVIAFIFPLYWLLLLQYKKGNRRVFYGFSMMLLSTLSGLVSAYLAAFCAIFTMSLVLVEALAHRKDFSSYWKSGLKLLFIAVIPLIFIKGFVDLTDWITDRPQSPGGFYSYNANPLSIFLSDDSIIRSILPSRMLEYAPEGRAYVGWPPTVLVLSTIIYMVYSLITRRRLVIPAMLQHSRFNHFLLAAIVVLLFSMCWPFSWGLQFIPDNITILKQFRALGRFSWIFYYVFTVYTAWVIYSLYEKLKDNDQKFLSILLLLFTLFPWALDACKNTRVITFKGIYGNAMLNANNDRYKRVLNAANINTNDYQAMLCLPFAQTNGDKMLFNKGENAFKTAMAFSYQSGLPIIQSFSPRLSFSGALTSIQLLANPCIKKERLADMTEKPILISVVKGDLSGQEKDFLELCELIYENKTLKLYRIEPNDILQPTAVCIERYQTFLDTATFDQQGMATAGDNAQKPLFISFDEEVEQSANFLNGTNAFYRKGGEHSIPLPKIDQKANKQKFECSFWLYMNRTTAGMPNVFLDEVNESGKIIKSEYFVLRRQHNVQGKWVRGSRILTLKKDANYQLRAQGREITIDDLLIKPVGMDVIMKTERGNMFNNFRIEN